MTPFEYLCMKPEQPPIVGVVHKIAIDEDEDELIFSKGCGVYKRADEFYMRRVEKVLMTNCKECHCKQANQARRRRKCK
mgnify:CR=1 FL=1